MVNTFKCPRCGKAKSAKTAVCAGCRAEMSAWERGDVAECVRHASGKFLYDVPSAIKDPAFAVRYEYAEDGVGVKTWDGAPIDAKVFDAE
jgi:transcription elongation factor Elf1